MRKIFLLAAFAAALTARSASAADQIDVDVDTTIEPVEAIGLVISTNGTEQRLDSTWTKRAGVVTVSVPLKSGDRDAGTVVTALIKGQDGSVAFGNTKAAWIKGISPSFYSLPECPIRKAPKGLASEAGLVQSLVEVRTARRNFLQAKIGNMLKGDFLKKLLKLERGFGMEQGRPLDNTLPPLELEDRLNRLETAILNYRAKKQSAAAQQPAESNAGETEAQ